MFRFVALCFFLVPYLLQASCCGGQRSDIEHTQTLQRDYDAVHEYIDSKRSIPLSAIADCLSISGDVRATWAHITERVNGWRQRGSDSIGTLETGCSCSQSDRYSIQLPSDAYEMEFNLYVDYVFQKAWAVSWIQFNNVAGLQGSNVCCCDNPQGCRGSGTCEGICLRKAYIGYNFISDGCTRLDVEIGRRPMWTIFESYIQFNSRFDGALAFLAQKAWGMDLYIKGGPFIIDERSHHYGYVGEAAILGLFNFDILYSLIHWKKDGPNRCGVVNPEGAQFVNSQLTLHYWLCSDYLWKKTKLYAAGLVNTDAKKREKTRDKRENLAWYAGFLMGEVCGAGDWSLDVCYQWVEAQSIPDCDVSGIGNGNAACALFSQPVASPWDARGRTNYKGWRFEALYAFTPNLVLDTLLEFSSAIDATIGGPHEYSKFQLQAIYAF